MAYEIDWASQAHTINNLHSSFQERRTETHDPENQKLDCCHAGDFDLGCIGVVATSDNRRCMLSMPRAGLLSSLPMEKAPLYGQFPRSQSQRSTFPHNTKCGPLIDR